MRLYLDDLKQTVSGVDGELYFAVDEAFFPAENWREPVSTVLELWIPGFLSFAQGHTDVCLLELMDGPYSVKLYRDASGPFRASLLQDFKVIRSESEIDLPELTRSVLCCLRTYDRTLHGWGQSPRWTKEQSVLKQLLKQV